MRKNRQDEHDKLVQEVKERNKQRREETTFTEVWYTFVDPYATLVDERGSDDSFRAVGVLIFKNGKEKKKHRILFLNWFIFQGKRIVDEYEWKYDNHVPLVSNENLIIYEIHIGDFEDQFKNVTAKIDHFVQLGITAGKSNKNDSNFILYFVILVEIMPIKEFPGKIGWGYTPRYYFAIESAYGTTVDLKEMIDTFHKNGIRVFMDGVYNHVSSFLFDSFLFRFTQYRRWNSI